MSGAGAGLLVGAAGDAASYGLAVNESNKAWRRQKRVLQNAVSWRVADMKRAGLNPILAINPGAASTAPNVNMAHTPSFSGAASGARDLAEADTKQTVKDVNKSQANALDSSTKLNTTKALTEREQAALNRQLQAESVTRQKVNAFQADQMDANATKARAEARILDHNAQEAEARAEMWSGNSRKAMQLREFMKGVTLFDKMAPPGRRMR